MLKHYVEYLYPSIFVSETSVSEISERDVAKIELSDNCFGFRFFDRTVTFVDGEILTGERKNVSGWHYQGEKMTLEQVKATYGNDENNGYVSVVKTKFGQFMPLNDGDTVI